MTDQVKYNNKLADKHVLVIGGSAGIGFGVAEAVLENGGRVTLSSSNPSRVQDAVARLQKSYPSAAKRVEGHAANLGDEATLEDNIKGLFEKTGKLNHVVFTAGDALATISIHDATMAQIKQAGMVRFFAPILVAKYAAKYLENSNASSITFTTGSVSERPIPGWSVVNGYATGIQGTTRALALDLKPIRVNVVSPGAVDTELWAGLPADTKEAMFAEYAKKMTTGTVGQVVDVAETYLYAMKDRNLSGSMISTNGGALLM